MVIPALQPPRWRPGDAAAERRRPAARRLPVPVLPARPERDLRFGLAVLDRYGRVADRATLRALGWDPGQALALTLTAGSVLAVPVRTRRSASATTATCASRSACAAPVA